MSFASFLLQFLKVAAGYLGGFIFLFVAGAAFVQGNENIGTAFALLAFVMILYGIYSEKGL